MKVCVVLGYYLNDDGTMDNILIKRLDTVLRLIKEEQIDFIITSGGIANEKAGVSESYVMKEYLIKKGVDESTIIMEDKSKTTRQNALYSAPIIDNLKPSKVIITSSLSHFTDHDYNPLKFFSDEIKSKDIILEVYSIKE